MAAAEAQPGSSVAAEEWLASTALAIATAADAYTVAAQRPVVITEAHIVMVAVESSSKADTSAGLGEHTMAAEVVAHSILAATEASGIVKEPSFEAKVDISIEKSSSYQHLYDYFKLCLSHQFSFKEEELAGTLWDRPVCFKAVDSAAIWHS